ncbi:MAG: DUF4954 family protein, partial [Bacteroidaceae bacterium]|nr:DUF4954 family protein [Bacteroidaceae bacterium]
MLAKADYQYELINPFPFALLSNDAKNDELTVMPAFSWMYNMYALARNTWKFANRDQRIFKVQNIEIDTFAPDSMEESIQARKLLEVWTAKAYLRSKGEYKNNIEERELRLLGNKLLNGDQKVVDALEILGEGMEKSKRKVRILKVYKSYHAYGDMIMHYAIKNALKWLEDNPEETFQTMAEKLDSVRQREWMNLGGQLIMMNDIEQLRSDINDGVLNSWKEIHKRYNEIWKSYPLDKLRHAYLALKFVLGVETISDEDWTTILDKEIDIQHYIMDQVYETRKKDYENPFRRATFRSEEEMIAAYGELEENSFIKLQREESRQCIERIQTIKKRLNN